MGRSPVGGWSRSQHLLSLRDPDNLLSGPPYGSRPFRVCHPALDADAIPAAQAVLAAQSGDTVRVSTTNVRHLSRFAGVDARPWTAIP
jgi:hypothetical protein